MFITPDIFLCGKFGIGLQTLSETPVTLAATNKMKKLCYIKSLKSLAQKRAKL